MYDIYLVEDEKTLNTVLKTYLEKEGWKVTSFLTGEEASRFIPQKPHLWILDIMLPDLDGYELLKRIKKVDENVPSIYISARDADLDRIIGLEMGSDDYLAKPFLPKELVVRTKKLLQRIYGQARPSVLQYGPYKINQTMRTIEENGAEIALSPKEFDIIFLFASHLGQSFSREEILNLIWGDNYFGSDRVVDDLVRRIRKKVPHLKLETIYAYGYRAVSL